MVLYTPRQFCKSLTGGPTRGDPGTGCRAFGCAQAVFIGAGIAAGSPSQGRIGRLNGGNVGRTGLIDRAGLWQNREGPDGSTVGIGDARGIPGAHLPVVLYTRRQFCKRLTGGPTRGDPGTGCCTIGRAQAVLIGAGIAAGSPSQGRIGYLVGGEVDRTGFYERPWDGKSTCFENGRIL